MPMVVILSYELVVFGILSQQLYRRWPTFWAAAPLAYLFTKVSSALLLAILPFSLVPTTPWQYFGASLLNALPGLFVLLLINWLLVKGVQRAA